MEPNQTELESQVEEVVIREDEVVEENIIENTKKDLPPILRMSSLFMCVLLILFFLIPFSLASLVAGVGWGSEAAYLFLGGSFVFLFLIIWAFRSKKIIFLYILNWVFYTYFAFVFINMFIL